jgi:hypothetical protein
VGEKLNKIRSVGEKVAHGVRSVGNEVGASLLSAAAPVAAFHSAVGGGHVSAGAFATGIGGIT